MGERARRLHRRPGKLIAHLHARQLTDLAELSANYPGIQEFLTTEIALALGVSEGTATARLAEADTSPPACRPPTPHCTPAGSPRARPAPSASTPPTTPEIAHQVEHDVLPDAPTSTIPQLRDLVAAAVIRRDPHGADERHEKRQGPPAPAQPDRTGRHGHPEGVLHHAGHRHHPHRAHRGR